MKPLFALVGLLLTAWPALAYPEDVPSSAASMRESAQQQPAQRPGLPALVPAAGASKPTNRKASLLDRDIPKGCQVPDWAMADVLKEVPSVDATRPLHLLVQPKSDSELNQAYVPVALATDGETWFCTEARIKAFVAAMTAPPLSYYGGYGGYRPVGGGSVYVRSHTRCNASKCWPVRSYWRRR
jgi:hypothetical protein